MLEEQSRTVKQLSITLHEESIINKWQSARIEEQSIIIAKQAEIIDKQSVSIQLLQKETEVSEIYFIFICNFYRTFYLSTNYLTVSNNIITITL